MVTRSDDHHPHHGHHGPQRPSVLDNVAEETSYRLHRRFDRLGRLYGDGSVAHLMAQKVVVIGLGGVGSFAAEALARSAIGHLMVVDFDDVCVTNSNRQLQALQGNVGKPKAWILRDRLRLINPQAKVEAKRAFYNAQRADEILVPPKEWGGEWSFVVDCIDNMTAKAHLLAECKKRGILVVSSMGAAGKLDPTRIKVADLADTVVDPLAREMRKILRTKYGFPPEGTPFGIQAVSSDERRHWPKELTYDEGEGFACVCPKGDEVVQDVRTNLHSCDEKTLIDGTAVFVTGAFGLACASVVVNTLTAELREKAPAAKAKQGTVGKTGKHLPGANAASIEQEITE